MDSPELAESLVDRFRVDLLFPVAPTDQISQFVKSHNYLLWPEFEERLFHERWQHIPPCAAFVDVYHAARRLRERRVRRRKMLMITCDSDDPLATLVLATVGAYPTPSANVPDYEDLVEPFLGIERIDLGRDDPIPHGLRSRMTPSRLTAVDLEADSVGPDHGVYVGDARNLADLVTFWNLRAAGSSLVFYDPQEEARLRPLLEVHKRWLASIVPRPWQEAGAITVYGRDIQADLSTVAERVIRQKNGWDAGILLARFAKA